MCEVEENFNEFSYFAKIYATKTYAENFYILGELLLLSFF